jgi:hypothetical protein
VRRQFLWARLAALGRPRRRRRIGIGLSVVVAGWWLVLGAVIVTLVPPSVSSAPPGAFRPSVGQHAHATGIGRRPLPIPVTRAAFDEAQRGFAESDEAAIDDAFEAYEWIELAERTAVRIKQIEVDVAEVELLDGPFASRSGWVKARHLEP